MSTNLVKNRDRILEAIDQLRRRKARPDVQRICNYLFRRFCISFSEAKTDLQWCVENNIVYKVEYKGSISYRNASIKPKSANSTVRRIHNNNGRPTVTNVKNHQSMSSQHFNQLLTNAFGELVVNEPDYLEDGVPPDEIIAHIVGKDPTCFTTDYITGLVEQEVLLGGLIKLPSGAYMMGPSKIQTPPPIHYPTMDTIAKKNKIRHHDVKTTIVQQRIGSRRKMKTAVKEKKRVKKVFDPSDNLVPKKRGRPAGSLNRTTIERHLAKLNSSDDIKTELDDGTKSLSLSSNSNQSFVSTNGNGRDQFGVCSVCHSTNKRAPNDRLIACRECSNKAHYSCLNGDDMMLKMYPDNTWQCPHCKTCVVCYETSDAGNLVVCFVCADAYHVSCHQPRVTERIRPKLKWLCMNCDMPDQLKINEIVTNQRKPNNDKLSSPLSSPATSPTPSQHSSYSSSPVPPKKKTRKKAKNTLEKIKIIIDEDGMPIDPSIPDATEWTADQVYQYFVQYFPKEAKIFKDQEIDGRSLLLLRRIDVLTTLALKLGPALKIFKHIVKLQVRRDDPKLYWL